MNNGSPQGRGQNGSVQGAPRTPCGEDTVEQPQEAVPTGDSGGGACSQKAGPVLHNFQVPCESLIFVEF